MLIKWNGSEFEGKKGATIFVGTFIFVLTFKKVLFVKKNLNLKWYVLLFSSPFKKSAILRF